MNTNWQPPRSLFRTIGRTVQNTNFSLTLSIRANKLLFSNQNSSFDTNNANVFSVITPNFSAAYKKFCWKHKQYTACIYEKTLPKVTVNIQCVSRWLCDSRNTSGNVDTKQRNWNTLIKQSSSGKLKRIPQFKAFAIFFDHNETHDEHTRKGLHPNDIAKSDQLTMLLHLDITSDFAIDCRHPAIKLS